MRPGKRITALCAFFALAIGLSACGNGVGGDAVVSMAGNPISTRAINHWLFVAAMGNAAQSPGAPVIVPNDPPDFKNCVTQARKQIPSLAKTPAKTLKQDCSRLFTSLSQQVMDFLIRAYWYQAEAAKDKIKVSDKEVQQALTKAKAQQFPTAAAFNQFLAQSGQTLEDIQFRVRINQLLKKLVAKEQNALAPISPARIQQYFQSHGSQFGAPESRDLRLVRTNSAAQANAAKAALTRGQSWNAVAKRYSVDTATKGNGGLLAGVTRGQQEQALDNAAFSSVKGKIVGPIHGSFGYYVIQVVKIKAATRQSLAQATPVIRQLLQGNTQQQAQTALDKRVKQHWLSKTKCRSAYAMADCSGYKAPKATAPAPGAGGAAGGTQQAPPVQTATATGSASKTK